MVVDANGQALGYVYFEEERDAERRQTPHLATRPAARAGPARATAERV
jgi:hypothetical protein